MSYLVQIDLDEMLIPDCKKYVRYKIYSQNESDSRTLIELWKHAMDYLIKKRL